MAPTAAARGRRRARWRRRLLNLASLPLALIGLTTLWHDLVVPLLPAPTLPAAPGAGVDRRLAEAIEASSAPAIGAAIVGPGVGRVSIHVAGTRERRGEAPVQADDRWHLGSDGKAMLAMVYARLVEQGRAHWGATVPELFPDLAGRIGPAWAGVTIEDLLSHRAGVRDTMIRWRLPLMRLDTRPADVQRSELAGRLLGDPPAGTRGSFAYSNLSYVLAGAAIERLTGLTFEAAMARELFEPLGLASAGFGAPRGSQPRGHRRPWFLFLGLGPVDPDGMSDNPPLLDPAGRMHMSLADWARVTAVFLRYSDGYLRPSSVDRLLATPAEGRPYALGWDRATGFDTPVFAHSGSNTMWYAVAMIAPERGVAVLVTANDGARGPQAIVPALARRLMDETLHPLPRS